MAVELPPESDLVFSTLGELACGGMGSVDLARTLDDSARLIAVKRLHPHLARDPDTVRMFLDEVWLTGALQHSNVVRLEGWGRDEDGMFLAMEFIDGVPLHRLQRTAARSGEVLAQELVAYVGREVAAGLAAAHTLRAPDGTALGVVHRDITPSNVLVSFAGRVVITDFGVAKATRRASTARTSTGVLKGKVPYMSPEYALGGAATSSADVYSLGVVLFELLTGSRPFSADSDLLLLKAIVEQPAPDVLALNPRCDVELASFVGKMLQKSADSRPASAKRVAEFFDAWLVRHGYDDSRLRGLLVAFTTRHGARQKATLENLIGSDEGAVRGSLLERARRGIPVDAPRKNHGRTRPTPPPTPPLSAKPSRVTRPLPEGGFDETATAADNFDEAPTQALGDDDALTRAREDTRRSKQARGEAKTRALTEPATFAASAAGEETGLGLALTSRPSPRGRLAVVAIGVAAGLLLFGLTIAVAMWPPSSTAHLERLAMPRLPTVTTASAAMPSRMETPSPVASAPPAATPPVLRRVMKPARAAQPAPTPVESPKPKKICTPTSWDYPSCLK